LYDDLILEFFLREAKLSMLVLVHTFEWEGAPPPSLPPWLIGSWVILEDTRNKVRSEKKMDSVIVQNMSKI
jgi:hypothetical protein